MELDVARKFDALIRETFKREEIRRFLLNHERKPVAIQNLCTQIRIAELSNIRKKFDLEQYNFVIKEVMKMFAQAALNHKEQMMLSHSEKARLTHEAHHLERCQDIIDQAAKEGEKMQSFPGRPIADG